MRYFFIAILTISLLTNCHNQHTKTIVKHDKFELPKPDEAKRLKCEAIQKLKNSGCNLMEPDTSLCGICLRNPESATKLIGSGNPIDSIEQYHFYSQFEREILTLTQHPGDAKNQIAIFKVEYSDKASYGYKLLNVDTFKTEKGIKLGVSKEQIITRLGNCYATIDSGQDYMELYYRIEQPNDSKSKLLQNNNMPVYYASYKICKGYLSAFEFGFEYP